MDRRQLLRYSPSFLAASAVASIVPFSPLAAARRDPSAALLVPQSGPHAALGRAMERAAMLAQGGNDKSSIAVFDTGGSVEGAAAAAAAARKKGASLILGPLRSAEVPAVLAQTGGTIPVVTFSNDAALRESGAFVFGITAQQSVRAILGYAAGRGIRRVAVGGAVGGSSDIWATQVRDAALAQSVDLGLTVRPFDETGAIPAGFAQSDDGLPDAILMAEPAALARLSPELAARNIQPLAAFPELDLPPAMMTQLTGTWLTAPDPGAFTDFARAFEQRMGTRPGIIAGLAFDAAVISATLRLSGGIDRSAILSANGFNGVCGHVRFRENGSASRALTVLALEAGGHPQSRGMIGASRAMQSDRMMTPNVRPASGESGFTLVELLVSLALFALISLAGVGLIETIIGVQQRTENRAERLSEIQRALYLLNADIEQLSSGPLIEDGSLLFTRGSAAGDYPVIYRYVDGALYRQAGTRELPMVEGVGGLSLRFFKNGVWTATPFTQDDTSRPKAIEMTLQLAPSPGRTAGFVRRVIELPDER